MNIFMNQWGSECGPEQMVHKEVMKAHHGSRRQRARDHAVSFASDAGELNATASPRSITGRPAARACCRTAVTTGTASDWNPDAGEHASIDDMVKAPRCTRR